MHIELEENQLNRMKNLLPYPVTPQHFKSSRNKKNTNGALGPKFFNGNENEYSVIVVLNENKQ